jgi:DNA-binding CsgD family transcriptional regulator
LIADTQPLWQNALGATLLRLGFGAVTACDAWDELEQLASQTRPHLVLVDPEGFPRVADHVCTVGSAPVVVVSARPQVAGGRTFVSKCGTTREIERALREAVATHVEWATLTRRQLEILRLVAGGLSNRQVARALWLSDQTVKFHLAQAYRKLGVSDRRAAVARVRQLGLLLEEPPSTVTTVGVGAP